MYDPDNTSHFQFLEEEKFLKTILELRKITSKLLETREDLHENLESLKNTMAYLCSEIKQSDNK